MAFANAVLPAFLTPAAVCFCNNWPVIFKVAPEFMVRLSVAVAGAAMSLSPKVRDAMAFGIDAAIIGLLA